MDIQKLKNTYDAIYAIAYDLGHSTSKTEIVLAYYDEHRKDYSANPKLYGALTSLCGGTSIEQITKFTNQTIWDIDRLIEKNKMLLRELSTMYITISKQNNKIILNMQNKI